MLTRMQLGRVNLHASRSCYTMPPRYVFSVMATAQPASAHSDSDKLMGCRSNSSEKMLGTQMVQRDGQQLATATPSTRQQESV